MNDIIGGANLFGGSLSGKSFTSDRFGYWQSALYLYKAYYQMPNGVYFNGDYTFCVWVKMNTINGQYDRIMSIGTSSYTINSIIFSLVSNYSQTPFVYTSANNVNYHLISPTNLPLNQWTHIAFTLSGSIGIIYLNGTNVKQGTNNIPSNINRTINYFGASWQNNKIQFYPIASFDEAMIFNRSLNQREIKYIINKQTQLVPSISITNYFAIYIFFHQIF